MDDIKGIAAEDPDEVRPDVPPTADEPEVEQDPAAVDVEDGVP